MPLVRLASFTGAGYEEPGDRIQVVVHSNGERSVGLIVEEILDITDADLALLEEVNASGVIGSVIVGDRITDLVDVESAVLAADPNFYREIAAIDRSPLAIGV
ncbi:CheW-like domain protein [mine drainage metagenome]|uniref:CheW-like domain protein n=1 Tax=mine drainage metagenome TaxID=410659 RepID=A0A1J5P669_9ZZZZ